MNVRRAAGKHEGVEIANFFGELVRRKTQGNFDRLRSGG